MWRETDFSSLTMMLRMRIAATPGYACKAKLSLLASVSMLLLILDTLALHQYVPGSPIRIVSLSYGVSKPNVALVVASQKQDNTTWLQSSFPNWNKIIYVTDDPDAAFVVPASRGHESMVYLTQVTRCSKVTEYCLYCHTQLHHRPLSSPATRYDLLPCKSVPMA